MTKSETYYFAGKCLVLNENLDFREKIIKVCENDLIDWQQFVAICSNNFVLPAIYVKFKNHNLLKYLPNDLQEHLLEIYKLSKKRSDAILKQIKSITILLNEQDIFPVYLKGAGNLLDEVYEDIGERLMIDIDFLVSEKDFLKSAKIMFDNGYLSYTDNIVLETWKWKHYPRLYHPDFPADIEIHRIPTHRKRNWFNAGIINAEKRPVSNFKGCFVPSFKHKIIHNFVHSQISHKGNLFGIVALRDIYDLYLLTKKFSLMETLPYIRKRKKAIAYFAFAKNVFEFDNQFFSRQNLNYKILKKKHELILNSGSFKKIYQNSILMFLIVKDRYFGKFIKFFYSKEIRQSVKRKLISWQS